MHHYKKQRKLLQYFLLSAIFVLLFTSSFSASNDSWTEASQTEAAKEGAFEKWSEQWETIKEDWTQISLSPGINATEINFAWYSKISDNSIPQIKISKNLNFTNSKELKVISLDGVKGYFSNKASATNLEEKTKYYYTYFKNGRWSDPVTFNTQNSNSFDFIYVGDPQIGSSSGNIANGNTKKQGQDLASRNDSFNWNNTLNLALSISPNSSFILSAGDQIQTRDKKKKDPLYTGNEIEYTAFLSPTVLKSLPIATSIGNHDALSSNYSFHFNNPNASSLGLSNAGGDYYYTYGNSLFIMLNTNNLNITEHKTFLEKAIKENPNTKWRIVTAHHDIYGSGEHSNEPKIVNLRYDLIAVFEDNNIDVVLTGHDHTYSRSFILKGGKINKNKMISDEDFDEYLEAKKSVDFKYDDYLNSVSDEDALGEKTNNDQIVNPKGILYMTANSASGSKYYELVDNQQAYVARRWQQHIPSFSIIHIDDTTFTIDTYRTDTMTKIDKTFSIIKINKILTY